MESVFYGFETLKIMDIKLKYKAWIGEKHADIAHKLIENDIETFALEFAEDLVKNCFIPNVMYWRDIDKEMPPEHEKVLVQLPDDVVLMAQMDSNGGWGIYWADGRKSMDIERPVLKWCELPACT